MMDKFDSMRLLARVIERRSFSAAAADLGLPRSTATDAIKQLEARLGTRLLDRTTRHVTPTVDGEAFYQRCLTILTDVEDAEGGFTDGQPRGRLRIDCHGYWARTFLVPHLPAFLARYPAIDLHLGEGDRFVDLVREGVDCALRHGVPEESGMIARVVATLDEITCASPAYLTTHGVPTSPDDLAGHECVGFLSSRTGEVMPLEFIQNGKTRDVSLPGRITVNGSETMVAFAQLGFGLVQGPRYRFDDDLASGRLVEVLNDFRPSPTPVYALYPQRRHVSPRLRVFLNWVIDLLAS